MASLSITGTAPPVSQTRGKQTIPGSSRPRTQAESKPAPWEQQGTDCDPVKVKPGLCRPAPDLREPWAKGESMAATASNDMSEVPPPWIRAARLGPSEPPSSHNAPGLCAPVPSTDAPWTKPSNEGKVLPGERPASDLELLKSGPPPAWATARPATTAGAVRERDRTVPWYKPSTDETHETGVARVTAVPAAEVGRRQRRRAGRGTALTWARQAEHDHREPWAKGRPPAEPAPPHKVKGPWSKLPCAADANRPVMGEYMLEVRPPAP